MMRWALTWMTLVVAGLVVIWCLWAANQFALERIAVEAKWRAELEVLSAKLKITVDAARGGVRIPLPAQPLPRGERS